MRLVCCLGTIVVLVQFSPLTARAPAQQPIHVVRHSPVDTARAGDVITISFDRPVAGSLDRSANPERFVRIDPPIAGKVEWRDLVTLRVIPNEPLPPKRRFRITVDTTFTAIDGGRLAAPYTFTLATFGPRVLGSIPSLDAGHPTWLDPSARLSFVYSSAVDSVLFENTMRVEIDGVGACEPQVIRYAVASYRAVADTDAYGIRAIGGYSDQPETRFRHIIELRPRTAVPEGCRGTIIIPSLDPNDRPEIRYPILTASPFRVAAFSCASTDCAASDALTLSFTSAVRRDSLLGRIHIEPETPFTIPEADYPSPSWSLRLTLVPHTTYRVVVDSTVRDVFGRALPAGSSPSLYVGDRQPALGHQLGFFTVSRRHPVLRLTHVNTDSARIAFVPIPEHMRTSVLLALGDPDSVARMVSRMRDSVKVDVALARDLNVERITEIPIPPAILERYRGSLIAIRARSIQAVRLPGDSPGRLRRRTVNEVDPIRIIASERELTNRVALVQVTDLAVHARVSNGPSAAFVTDLETGRPVPGAAITLRDNRGQEMATGTTDTSGVARLQDTPGWLPRVRRPADEDWVDYAWADRYASATAARVIDVRRGDDRSVVTVAANPYADWYPGPARADAPEVRAQLVRAMAYTDRAIYRPGERVYLGLIARTGWLGELRPLPHGDSLRIRIGVTGDRMGPDIVRDTVLRLGEFGTAADSFALPAAATLGTYQVRVEAMSPGGWRSRTSVSFRVAEYRAPQFHATLELDSAVQFLGDTIHARATGAYYFGAAMPGAPVSWSTRTMDAGTVDIPALPDGFVVARRYRGGWGGAEDGGASSGSDTLDAHGVARLTMPTVRGSLIGPAQVSAEIVVEDVDRQIVVATQSTILHSSSFYIAARDSGTSWYWRQGQRRVFDVLAVTPTGRRVPGVRVDLTIIRRHGGWVSTANGGAGAWRWVTDTIGRDSIVTADSIVHVAFVPTRDGSYELAFTTRDQRDRPVATSLGGYVIPPHWFGTWGLDPASLALRLARDTVAPGDSAVLSVLSPFPRAEAWVTVEREGILAQLRRTVRQGDNVFRIPVDARFVPNAEVSVLLVNSEPAWQTDSVHRRIRTGSVSLIVDRSSKALAVDVRTSARRYAPGDSARVLVRLRDHRGAPVRGQVTVWAVDESVLALTESDTLNPVASMYAERGSSLVFASTAPTLASLARLLRPSGWARVLGLYGSAALNSLAVVTGTATGFREVEITPRTDFRTTAFYLASLESDAGGAATAMVKLPENLTTYRVFAVAVDRADRFGAAEASLLITKPLLARAALPRFMRTGDTFVAGAVITNQTGAAVTANVTASARAIALESTGSIERPLPNGASAEARFEWRSTASPGDTASVRFVVTSGGDNDAVETPVVVRAPYSPRFHAMAGVTRGSEIVRMMLPPGIDPVRSRLTLRVGTTPASAVHAAYQQLAVYPYLCSEQLASRGRGIIAMLRLERAGLLDSVTAPHPAELRGQLQWVVDELVRRQTAYGGIGYWSGSSWTTSPLTLYAGLVLLDARDLGVTVRPLVLTRIADYMKAALDHTPALPDSVFGTAVERRTRVATRLAGRLAGLQYLRRAGLADPVHEDELLTLAAGMAWEDRVWLTELLARRDDRTPARRLLAAVWRDVEVSGTRVDIPDSLLDTFGFRSHVRPVARLLMATLAVDRDNPRLPWLVERVVQQGAAVRDRLWNTQDYAAAAEALAEVALWQGRAPRGSVTVQSARRGADTHVLLASTAGRNAEASISLDGLVERDGEWTALPLRISAGDTRVFYALTVEEVPLTPPTTPDVKGIVVERWYERFDDGRPTTEVKEGELVRARLRITIPSDREFVAVADPLPAGLEVVDLSLQTSRTIGPFESAASEAAAQAGDRANPGAGGYYGRWYGGWWSPWEHQEMRDDRVTYYARVLWKGTYTASYVARATTAGTFIRPPAHAEEMYNRSLGGRSDGGTFRVMPR